MAPAPTGATTGNVVVTVGGVASNGLTFTVQADTNAPSVPTGLTATAASSSQINLSWTASTDNVGVTGYKVYRGGTQVGTSMSTAYADSGLTASTSYSYTVAAYDAAGNTSAQSISALATTLASSGGGQIPSALGWYQIPNTSIQSLCPSYSEIQASSGCSAVMSAWSGALFDTKRNRLIIHGGGHSDYYGNEIYAIDFNTNPISAVLVKDASHGSAISNVTSTPEAFNDGTPNARHTYNGWVYLPTQDSYLLYGAGLSADGPFSDGQWLFSPSNSTWTQQHPTTHPNTAKTGSIPQHAYDPVTDTVYFVEGNASQFWQLNPGTGQWTSLGSSGTACGNDNATSSIDPGRRLYACVGNGELYTVSLNSPYTVTNDTSAPGCSTLAGTNSPGFAYDPVQQLFVGWAGGNTVYTYNPAAHSCSAITSYSGGPTTIQPNGTFGRFRYAPALGVFVVINDITSNAYSLRLTPVSGGSGGPNITNVTVTGITTSGATIGWTTDITATSQVEYGLTTAYGTMTTMNSSLVMSHSVALNGLVANTLYHYRVHSKNSSGVESIGGDAAFTTSNTTDKTPPTASITSPVANASLAGTVSVTANASDNVAVASVQFLVDGANLGAPVTAAPYTTSWDTTTVVNGAHTLSATATDTSGNVGNATGVVVNATNSTSTSNFQALCIAPGVVKCVTWDSPSAFTPATGGAGYASGLYPAEDGTYQGVQDTTNKVDGAGSLEFAIRPGSVHPHGTNPAGYWFQQFGTDGAPTNFGEGTTLYMQFRFKVSPSMLNYDWTQAGGEGWKVFIVFGPVPGPSCTSDQFVQENTNQTNVATAYVSCGTPGLYTNDGNPPMDIEQGDYNCAYAGSGATYTGPNCFVYPASTWITEYWVVHIGTFGQSNSTFQAWIAPEGQPLKQFLNLPNFNFGDVSNHTVGLNAIELTPYFSGANGSTTTPAASMWFDDLIISTQPIAAPNN
ncbi:MAG: Ig-like domain-containing protein [Candidatus Acidiferrum sp.]